MHARTLNHLKSISIAVIIGLVINSCQRVTSKEKNPIEPKKFETINIYSPEIHDSFSIYISLPKDYSPKQKTMLPVVYILDANVYFEVFKTIVHNYSEVGLIPSVILVGIGYKDLYTLDSLRSRDYTFPIADARYEMRQSGGAGNFLMFLDNHLIPYIDQRFPNDTMQRTIFGHSLGGYFVEYALQQRMMTGNPSFSNYIAASPSLHYNHHYLLEQFNSSSKAAVSIKHYLSYGLLEDEEEQDVSEAKKVRDVAMEVDRLLQINHLSSKTVLFSEITHMETAIPSFIQGLNWIYSTED